MGVCAVRGEAAGGGFVEEFYGGFLGVDACVGENFAGGEALGDGVFAVPGEFVEGVHRAFGEILGLDFALELLEVFAEVELELGLFGAEEIAQLLLVALEVFAEHFGVGVAEGDGVESRRTECRGLRSEVLGVFGLRVLGFETGCDGHDLLLPFMPVFW